MATSIKQLIENSGKKTVVTYKNKEKRIKFDETVSQKKMEIISNFIGGKSKELSQILNKK